METKTNSLVPSTCKYLQWINSVPFFPDLQDNVPDDVVLIEGSIFELGERMGLTGETAIDKGQGTGEDDRGVEPVGVVLPLLG